MTDDRAIADDAVFWQRYEDIPTTELLGQFAAVENLGQFIEENIQCYSGADLVGFLTHLLAVRQINRADAVKASGLSLTFGFQIFSGVRKPSRDKLLALAFGIGMDDDECRRTLMLAGYSPLYLKNRRDAAIAFGLRKRLDVYQLDQLLFDLGEPLLLQDR
jgi:hypothetical protein